VISLLTRAFQEAATNGIVCSMNAPLTMEEELRCAERALALASDVAALAAGNDDIRISHKAFHALAELTRRAEQKLQAVRTSLPPEMLNVVCRQGRVND
jgi:hypothetical protein